jgi:hypothetical protein
VHNLCIRKNIEKKLKKENEKKENKQVGRTGGAPN